MDRKNFLFHDTTDGAKASAVVLRDSKSQSSEYLPVSLHTVTVYAGLQK
jgi:hypothetical protein